MRFDRSLDQTSSFRSVDSGNPGTEAAMGFRALLLLCGISTASAFVPCSFSGQGALACTAKSAISKR